MIYIFFLFFVVPFHIFVEKKYFEALFLLFLLKTLSRPQRFTLKPSQRWRRARSECIGSDSGGHAHDLPIFSLFHPRCPQYTVLPPLLNNIIVLLNSPRAGPFCCLIIISVPHVHRDTYRIRRYSRKNLAYLHHRLSKENKLSVVHFSEGIFQYILH